MEFIQTHLSDIWAIVTTVVTLASMVAALTPTAVDDTVVAKVQAVVKKVSDLLALNILHASTKK